MEWKKDPGSGSLWGHDLKRRRIEIRVMEIGRDSKEEKASGCQVPHIKGFRQIKGKTSKELNLLCYY